MTKIDLPALYKIQYGIYVISSHADKKVNAQIATVVAQITSTPMQIITCICKDTLTHEYMQRSGMFGVSILDQTAPLKFIGNFGFRSGRECDKFATVNCTTNLNGCPLLAEHTLVVMEAKVNHQLDVGTHTLFIADLLSAQTLKEGTAMTYEYYHHVVKGKSPKNAPTYQKSN